MQKEKKITFNQLLMIKTSSKQRICEILPNLMRISITKWKQSLSFMGEKGLKTLPLNPEQEKNANSLHLSTSYSKFCRGQKQKNKLKPKGLGRRKCNCLYSQIIRFYNQKNEQIICNNNKLARRLDIRLLYRNKWHFCTPETIKKQF